MKISDAISLGTKILSATELNPREIESDIRFMLACLLKPSSSSVGSPVSGDRKELTPEQEKTFNIWIERRLTLEPVQYITGETEFWSLPFYVGQGVLVPRQDTETLVSEIKDHFSDDKKRYRFLDMCCGTGCVGISLLTIFPNSTVVFVDKYSTPIKYTQKNLARLELTHRAAVITSDMFSSIPNEMLNSFDAIAANPPYIPDSELKGLPMQITLFEPTEALRAGANGLMFHNILASEAQKFLKPSAPLFVEIGYNQGQDVSALFRQHGWSSTQIVKDMADNPRVLIAKP
ncbi:MAG: peptide chain release factor N(5)-glutamine methyltransferase [Pseudomonadota bacterium]